MRKEQHGSCPFRTPTKPLACGKRSTAAIQRISCFLRVKPVVFTGFQLFTSVVTQCLLDHLGHLTYLLFLVDFLRKTNLPGNHLPNFLLWSKIQLPPFLRIFEILERTKRKRRKYKKRRIGECGSYLLKFHMGPTLLRKPTFLARFQIFRSESSDSVALYQDRASFRPVDGSFRCSSVAGSGRRVRADMRVGFVVDLDKHITTVNSRC